MNQCKIIRNRKNQNSKVIKMQNRLSKSIGIAILEGLMQGVVIITLLALAISFFGV